MTMLRMKEPDEAVVARARRVVASKRKFRWVMLMYAALFLGLSVYMTFAAIRKIEKLDAEQLSMGFVYGLTLAVVWTSFGVLGALCFGKFLVGFTSDFRTHELLVRYHDRLRDLRDLQDEKIGEPDGAASGSKPFRSDTNRTVSAAESSR